MDTGYTAWVKSFKDSPVGKASKIKISYKNVERFTSLHNTVFHFRFVVVVFRARGRPNALELDL